MGTALPPPYGARRGFVPRRQEDFGDGGKLTTWGEKKEKGEEEESDWASSSDGFSSVFPLRFPPSLAVVLALLSLVRLCQRGA